MLSRPHPTPLLLALLECLLPSLTTLTNSCPSSELFEFSKLLSSFLISKKPSLNPNELKKCRSIADHVKRRDQDYVGIKTLEMVPPVRRKRVRPKQRWMDCVYRDMRAIGTTKDEVHDRTGWRRIISVAATPQPSGSG